MESARNTFFKISRSEKVLNSEQQQAKAKVVVKAASYKQPILYCTEQGKQSATSLCNLFHHEYTLVDVGRRSIPALAVVGTSHCRRIGIFPLDFTIDPSVAGTLSSTRSVCDNVTSTVSTTPFE
jgi:hypothetical protein